MSFHRTVGAVMMVLATWLAPRPPAAATTPPELELERVVILMRHGIRSPLSGEVPPDTRSARPWPRWPVAESVLTRHGAAAMAILGRSDRRWLPPVGVGRCPAPHTVRIWTNTALRTIASGQAYVEGLAPGCGIAVGHLAGDAVDPLFEPLRSGTTGFDARRAVAAIDAYTGGMDTLVSRHRNEITVLDRILGCRDPRGCATHGPAALTPSADGHGVDLTGAIRATSGIAQVLLLQYAEGMPARDVGWGRADAAAIERIGALHAALFDVFTQPPYMAAHQAAVFGRRILATLTDRDGPRLDVLVGHDTNVTALAAALRVDLDAPGFARGDVPPGGALVVALYRDPATGARLVGLRYRTQSLDDMRVLQSHVAVIPVAIPGCSDARGLCPLARFVTLMTSRIAPAGGAG